MQLNPLKWKLPGKKATPQEIAARSQVNPVSHPTINEGIPRPDAEHPVERSGRWYTSNIAALSDNPNPTPIVENPVKQTALPVNAQGALTVHEAISTGADHIEIHSDSSASIKSPIAYTSESNVAQKIAPVIISAATAAPTVIKETPVATTPVVVKPTIGQDIGNFFHKLLVDVDKGFAFVDKIEVAAQPVVGAIDAAIAPLDPPLAAAIAAGDGLINGVFSVTGSVLNTINTVGATSATVEQKMAAALPAIEQEILSDPTLAGAVKAVGGTPTKIAQFNTSLTAAAQALYLLTTAI